MELYLLIAIVLAVVPSLLLIWYFYSRDVNPEPRSVLIITFILGIVTVAPVLVVALPTLWFVVPMMVYGEGVMAVFAEAGSIAFLSAAIPEEFCKWLVVVLYCSRHVEFDEPMDGLVYGAVASLGFATFENVLYVWLAHQQAPPLALIVAVTRGLTAVPCHACLGAIMGYYVGQARFARTGNAANYVLSLVVPIILHGLYDLPALALPGLFRLKETNLILICVAAVFGILIFMVVWTLILVWRLRSQQLERRSLASGDSPGQ